MNTFILTSFRSNLIRIFEKKERKKKKNVKKVIFWKSEVKLSYHIFYNILTVFFQN